MTSNEMYQKAMKARRKIMASHLKMTTRSFHVYYNSLPAKLTSGDVDNFTTNVNAWFKLN